MPRTKRIQGCNKRRLAPFGSGFCGLSPEVALAGASMQLSPDSSGLGGRSNGWFLRLRLSSAGNESHNYSLVTTNLMKVIVCEIIKE